MHTRYMRPRVIRLIGAALAVGGVASAAPQTRLVISGAFDTSSARALLRDLPALRRDEGANAHLRRCRYADRTGLGSCAGGIPHPPLPRPWTLRRRHTCALQPDRRPSGTGSQRDDRRRQWLLHRDFRQRRGRSVKERRPPGAQRLSQWHGFTRSCASNAARSDFASTATGAAGSSQHQTAADRGRARASVGQRAEMSPEGCSNSLRSACGSGDEVAVRRG
jgi:hypothetical protein